MARGKIQIKLIENTSNRQVTYSKRRHGLFKKANELTVLCDARVSIIMISTTGKLHEFISLSTSTKQIVDQYQKTLGIDIWNTHYEKMQEQSRQVKEVNMNLRKKIRQRMGECLNAVNMEDLRGLEQEIDSSIKLIRIESFVFSPIRLMVPRRMVRNGKEIHNNLLHELDVIKEDPYSFGYQNRSPRIFALRLQHSHPGLQSGGGSDLTTYPLLE